MKTLCIGDINGNHRGLIECLMKSDFNYDEDKLIILGNVIDGWFDSYECVEELLKIKNKVLIKGDRDDAFADWLDSGMHRLNWKDGGFGTLKSYGNNCFNDEEEIFRTFFKMNGFNSNLEPKHIPKTHKDFFHSAKNFHILNNYLFIHAGFNRHKLLYDQDEDFFNHNESLWREAMDYRLNIEKFGVYPYKFNIKEKLEGIFIGHNSTTKWKSTLPMKASIIWNLNTGSKMENGKLTIMNIETKEYWQSMKSGLLYYGEVDNKI